MDNKIDLLIEQTTLILNILRMNADLELLSAENGISMERMTGRIKDISDCGVDFAEIPDMLKFVEDNGGVSNLQEYIDAVEAVKEAVGGL